MKALYQSDLKRLSASTLFGDGRMEVQANNLNLEFIVGGNVSLYALSFVGHRKGRGIRVEHALSSSQEDLGAR